jgi:hypothetical protein
MLKTQAKASPANSAANSAVRVPQHGIQDIDFRRIFREDATFLGRKNRFFPALREIEPCSTRRNAA